MVMLCFSSDTKKWLQTEKRIQFPLISFENILLLHYQLHNIQNIN